MGFWDDDTLVDQPPVNALGPPPPSVPGSPFGGKPGRWAAGARQVRDALVGNMGDMGGFKRGYKGQSTVSMHRALSGLNPALGEAYLGAKEAIRPARVLAEHPYSRERQAVTYGGQDPRNIQTSRIQMAHPGNLSENEREMDQRRNVLNYEAETGLGGQGSGLPDLMPGGGPSALDFGRTATLPAMRQSGAPSDMLHRQSSGVLWGDTHTQAMGNMWADPHTRAVSGIGLPGRDPFPGIRAPRPMA